ARHRIRDAHARALGARSSRAAERRRAAPLDRQGIRGSLSRRRALGHGDRRRRRSGGGEGCRRQRRRTGRGHLPALRNAGGGHAHGRGRPGAADRPDRDGCDRLRRGPGVTGTTDPGFEELLGYVRDTRSFDYTGYRRPTLMRRFQKRMQTVGAETWEAYRTQLEHDPDEFAELFNAILINVTGFFRDKETWELVESKVVPRIIEQKDPGAPIRVWSAGCASGEEAYTIMMILAEHLGEDELKSRVKIYATDIDEEALQQAREATFTRKQLEPVPPTLRD